MKDAYEGLSSADLIREAREELASRDLVSQARELLDIANPSADIERHMSSAEEIERHIETVAEAPRPDTVAEVLRQVRRAPQPEVTAEPEEEDRRRFQLPADIIRPRRRSKEPSADGRMIEAGDRLPTGMADGPLGRPRRTRRYLGIAAAIFVIISFVGSYFEDQAAEDSPTVEVPPEPIIDTGMEEAVSVSLADVDAGMCIQQPTQETFFDVDAVPCNEPHDFEVIGNVLLFGSEFPGDDAVYDEAFDRCLPLFESYVGVSYDTSIWWLNAFTPTAEGWADGDQRATCMVFQYSDDNEILRVTTSARGDGR